MSEPPAAAGRRPVLRAGIAGLGAFLLAGTSGCTPQDRTTPLPARDTPPVPETAAAPDRGGSGSVLLAYFSRAGENYYYGGRITLEVGNTEALAGLIRTRIGCDVHRIEAAEPYSEDYDATVARNVREQDADARPAIANPLPNIKQYDTVLLASGIWNVRAPMIMTTFAEQHDFTGKNNPSRHHVCHERSRDHRKGLRQSLPGRHDRDGAGSPGRESNPGDRPGHRILAGRCPPYRRDRTVTSTAPAVAAA